MAKKVEEGVRITDKGQIIERMELTEETNIDFKQNSTTGGYSDNFSVTIYNKEVTNGRYDSVGSISQVEIPFCKRILPVLLDLCGGDIEKLMSVLRRIIKDETSSFSIENLNYSEYVKMNEYLSNLRND